MATSDERPITVCAECMEDEYFKEYIRATASECRCSYCKRRSRHPIAIPLDELVDRIYSGLTAEYDDAANQPVPYESAEGGYLFPTMETGELLWDVGFYAGNDDLQDRIIRALPSHAWIRRHPLSLPQEDRLSMGWEEFSNLVKHRARYLMFPTDGDRDTEVVAPGDTLRTLGELVSEHGLLGVIPTGTVLYRVRIHEPGLVVSTPAELGAPPRDRARFSNRMSPAGVSLFYGALEAETALAETYVRHDGLPAEATIAPFEVTEDIRVLNLVDLPPIPSLFADDEPAWRRPFLIFLHGFVEDFTKPVIKDGREHVEYVPSQVVTEYFRFRFREHAGEPVRGILYGSAALDGGRSCVLFAGHEDFTDDWTFGRPTPLPLTLLRDRIVRQPVDTSADGAP